jgi:hypothetical protein
MHRLALLVLLLPLLLLGSGQVAQGGTDSPTPLCVVIDDQGHCAPAGLYTAYTPVTYEATKDELGLDATGCKWRHTRVGLATGSLGYHREVRAFLRWCTKNGVITKWNGGPVETPNTGPLCSPTGHGGYVTSGGVGTPHIDYHFYGYYACAVPWPIPVNTDMWVDSRMSVCCGGYMTNWKGKN